MEFALVAGIGIAALVLRFIFTVAAVVVGLWVWDRWGARLRAQRPPDSGE